MGQMIAQFNRDNIKILSELGYEVHLAANFKSKHNTMTVEKLAEFCDKMKKEGIVIHQVDFERKIGAFKSNMIVWKQLLEICQKNSFALIHCQSPLGGFFGRLLGHKLNIKVIYTAHGFHFFKGSPKKNWILYYPIERFLAKYTDTLIVINSEDFKIAKHFKKNLKVIKIPGVGIDCKQINLRSKNVDRKKFRKEFNISENTFLMISVGELSSRKNQETIIRALHKIQDDNISYLIVGIGEEYENLMQITINLRIENKVIFTGYRKDIPELLGMSDVSVFPSKREGLGLAGLESMAAGLPLIASNVNGILEYAEDGKSGYLCSPNDIDGFAEAIQKMKRNKNNQNFSNYNLKISEKFDKKITDSIMRQIYLDYL